MRTNNFISECGYLRPRVVAAAALCGAGALLAGLSVGAIAPSGVTAAVATSANHLALAPTHSDLVSDNAAAWSSGTPLAATQTPGWSIVASPNINSGQRQHSLDGVTCVSASDCWAVGWYANDQNIAQTIIERWNGSTWSVVPSQNTSTTQYNFLDGVTCTSTFDCWAVGYYYNASYVEQTLIEHWNGSSWSIVTSPNSSATLPNILNAVTCSSASDCWAVGTSGQFATGSIEQTLIEHWNGSSWVIVNSPNTSPTQGNSLFGVTCASKSDCWAVGNHWGNPGIATLIEHWNGVSWSIAKSPNPDTGVNELHSVTCASASDCWAVGDYNGSNTNGYYQTLIIRWNGHQWKIVTSPNASVEQDTFLYGVTCASASNCWAVGSTDYYHPLIERWNGKSWTVISGADVGPDQSLLQGVACSAVSQCWTVGYYTTSRNTAQTLVERWDGTVWTIADSPNNNIGTLANDLFDVACASPSDCWAVGYYNVDSTIPNISFDTRPLILHWDGNLWATASAPNADSHYNLLTGVTCTSTSNCWAVGNIEYSQPLIEHWDGSSWTIVTSPDNGRLNEVTCASASDCWAVGSYYNATFGNLQPFIEHWNGISWSLVNAPSASFNYSELFGVTCASTSSCWAVGYYLDSNYVSHTLVEHWNGAQWSVVQSENAGTSQNNALQDVTCSATDCWAVGQYYNGTVQQTLIERPRGPRWTIVASPNADATQDNFLSGVTCFSGSLCFAVGHYRNNNPANQTLIEQWNGKSWTIVNSPNTSADKSNSLNRVTCTSDSTCWAVGEYLGGTYDYPQTLIEKYSPSASP
jgi:hypothetical protein